jgi:hypothetical protein
MKYKCICLPEHVFSAKKGHHHNQTLNAYQTVLNEEAANGWILDHIDTVTSTIRPGCLGFLFGRKAETITYKVLIFKKDNAND